MLALLDAAVEGADPLDSPPGLTEQVPLPERVGPYRVLGQIGAGGMGIVYRAQREGGDNPIVALKVLRAGLRGDEAERRFLREIEVLKRLDHPGIAHLVEAGVADGAPYIAMELVAGQTLSAWRTEGERPIADKLRLLADLCDAVHYAHARGVIHRDLKPENVLVTPAGKPKVLDFGIARLAEVDAPGQAPTTQTWQILGTIRYMSPEQVTGGSPASDARTDVYSLGVIAYELLSDTLPYNIKRLATPRALLEIAYTPARTLAAVGYRAPRDVESIIQHALEKSPDSRYQSAADLAADLRRHLAGQPISLRRLSHIARLRRELGARPRLRMLSLGLGIATVAAVATFLLLPRNDRTPVTWEGLFERLEQADQLRHSGPETRENYLAAAAQFQQARGELAQLPPRPYAPDLNRYIKWRLGELHYFIGSHEHDAAMLEQARGYWRDAATIPWTPGTATSIDTFVLVREKVLRIGWHHPQAGLGFALAGLAGLHQPATNWRGASVAQEMAVRLCSDPQTNYQDFRSSKQDSLFWTEDLAYAYLNRGIALSALGAVVDSAAVVDLGLSILRASAAIGGLRTTDGQSLLAESMGTGLLRRLEIELASAQPLDAATELDSIRGYLDHALDLCDLGNTRACWRLHRALARAAELRARLEADPAAKRRHLAEAAAELQQSFKPLRDGIDDFERARAQGDLAAVEAELALPQRDRSGFARADSLLALAEAVLTSTRFPIQYAETALRRAQVLRCRWQAFATPADSAGAASALADAQAAVLRAEYPSLHRRVAEEARHLASGGD